LGARKQLPVNGDPGLTPPTGSREERMADNEAVSRDFNQDIEVGCRRDGAVGAT
jgi:hypothetical protein